MTNLNMIPNGCEVGQRPSFALILRTACDLAGVSKDEMTGPSTKRHLSYSRQAVMYLARQHTPLSLPDIARRLGRADHATVIHGRNAVAKEIESGVAEYGSRAWFARLIERELGL